MSRYNYHQNKHESMMSIPQYKRDFLTLISNGYDKLMHTVIVDEIGETPICEEECYIRDNFLEFDKSLNAYGFSVYKFCDTVDRLDATGCADFNTAMVYLDNLGFSIGKAYDESRVTFKDLRMYFGASWNRKCDELYYNMSGAERYEYSKFLEF